MTPVLEPARLPKSAPIAYTCSMPTNEFQQLVYLVQRQLKTRPDAVVSESKRLVDRDTGIEREVDVVVEFLESNVPFILAYECQSGGRKPDIEWVEQQIKKHEHLSDKLVLVTARPLTANAIDLARRHRVETIELGVALQTDWSAFIDAFTDLYFASFDFRLIDWQVTYGPGPEFDPAHPIMATQGAMRGELPAMIATVLRNYDLFAKPVMDLWSKLPVAGRRDEHRIDGNFSVPQGAPPLILSQGELEHVAQSVSVVVGAKIGTTPLVMTSAQYGEARVLHGKGTLDRGSMAGQTVRLVMTERRGKSPRAELAFIEGKEPEPSTVELQFDPKPDDAS
jgi:hypothetical protein